MTLHREMHRAERIGWLRAAVLGANDGIVSTASLVVGVAAARAAGAAVRPAGRRGELRLESEEVALLKPGEPYSLDIIKTERLRIDAFLKERGFYYFDENYLIVQVDSTIGNQQVNMFVNVKPETPEVARRVYTINDIFVYSNYPCNLKFI